MNQTFDPRATPVARSALRQAARDRCDLEFGGGSSDVQLRLTPDGDNTVLELEHSPIPVEIIPNASPEMWGLGAGWEMGLKSLGDYLAGIVPEGRAVDWVAKATPEDLIAVGGLAAQISEAWAAVIAAHAG